YTRLELRSLLKQLPGWVPSAPPGPESGPEAAPQPAPAAADAVPRNYDTVLTDEQLGAWLERPRGAELFAFDTETTSLDYMQAEIVGVSFCVEPGHAAYVPLAHRYPGAPQQLDRDAVLQRLEPLLSDPRHAKL